MKVVITGAAGKVGGMVRWALAGRHELRFLDVSPVAEPEGEMLVGSVLDPEVLARAVAGMDAVIHLAYGAATGATAEENDDLSFRVNAQGTFCVARAAAQAGVPHIVYASTLSLYDGHHPGPGERFSEKNPPAPAGVYSLTKYFGEEALRTFARRGCFSATCLRLTHPTWPEEWERERERYPDSAHARTAAADVGEAFRLALENPGAGFRVFHIASEHPQCRWDISKAKRVLGYRPTAWFE